VRKQPSRNSQTILVAHQPVAGFFHPTCPAVLFNSAVLFSEKYFEGELNPAGLLIEGRGAVLRRPETLSFKRRLPELRELQKWNGVVEIRMIEEIEELGPELQATLLA
jgi:hypothetical protein